MAVDLSRATEFLSGGDTLLPTQTDTILHGSDPGGLPVGADGLPLAGDLTSSLGSDSPVALANDAVLDLHSQLEGAADANGLVGAVHGITSLGETAGLGHLGSADLLTTVLQAPTALASGDTSSLAAVVPQATALDGALDALASGAAGDAGLNPDLTGALADPLAIAHGFAAAPLTGAANSIVGDVHSTLEASSDVGGLSGTVHGVTGLGETIGLGEIGGSNLVTDVLDTPQALLAGDTSSLAHLPADLGAISTAAQGLVSGVEADLASGTFLTDPVGNVLSFAGGLAELPVTSIANEAINSAHSGLELGIDPLAPDTIHGITGLGNAVGLGDIGGSNALTDALSAPGALLGGDTTSLSHLPADVGTIGSAVAALPGDVGTDLAQSGLVDALTHPATGGGVLAGDLPGAGVVATVTSTVSGLVDTASGAAGLSDIGHVVTGALDGAQSGLVHDVAALPGDGVAGLSSGLAPLPGDVASTLGTAGSLVGASASDLSHVADTGGLGAGGLGAGGLGSAAAPLTGALDAVTHLAGGSGAAGSSDLANVSLGPQTAATGLSVGVLPNGADAAHLVDVHSGSAATPTPVLANVAVLPDSIHIPAATGGGADALSGVVTSITHAAAPAAAAAASPGLDLGIAHVDVPVAAHAEPLHGLAHAV